MGFLLTKTAENLGQDAAARKGRTAHRFPVSMEIPD
jgi:hypothetical protein